MPPEDQEGVYGAGSPTAEETTAYSGVEAGSPPADGGDVTSDSSTGSDGGQQEPESYKDGLLQAATEAAKETGSQAEEEAESDSDGQADAEADSDKDQQQEEQEEDEDGKKLPPFHKHPRWQEMVRERNQLREQVDEFKQGAEEYRKIESFMQENELSAQEVARAMQTVALMRNDPSRAREILAQELETLDRAVGEKLPDDLQREVEDGYMTEERAKELARLRNEQSRTAQQAEQERRRAQEAQQQAEQQRRQQAGQQALQQQQEAVRSWEQSIKSRDPDFERIQPLVYKELRWMVREGMDQGRAPRTPDEAVKLAERAYSNVKEQLRRVQPRQQTQPGPTSKVSGGSAGSGAQPQSMQDAVIRAAGLG